MTLLQSPHPSTSPVTLGYQDIYILFHTDRFPLSKTITGSHFSQGQLFIGMPCQPTYQFFPPWHSSAVLFARWSMSLPKHQFLFLPFNYTNTLFTLYKLISPPFSKLLFQLTPFKTWFLEARARVGRPQTSSSPPVILLLVVPTRLFCFGSLVILDVARCYLWLFTLYIKIKIGKNSC